MRFAAELDAEASINSSSTHASGDSSRDQRPASDAGLSNGTAYKSHLLRTNPQDESHWHSLRNMPVHAEAAQSAAYQVETYMFTDTRAHARMEYTLEHESNEESLSRFFAHAIA